MICEMCGTDVDQLTRVRVEGSVLSLCEKCQRFGTPIDPPPTAPVPPVGPSAPRPSSLGARVPPRTRRLEERDLYKEMPEMELADDWPKRIRLAREKLAWTPEELGKRLNEKKSVVLKMESGHFRPPDQTIHKIEQLLKIRLRADPAAPS